MTYPGRRTSVLRVFTIAATLTTSYHIGTVRRDPVDVNWCASLVILCPCGHMRIRSNTTIYPRFIVCVLTRNSEGITPDICSARSSSPAETRTFQRMPLELGSCQVVNTYNLPGDNQPDMPDQFVGSKKRPSATPPIRIDPGPEQILNCPHGQIQVSCPVDGRSADQSGR